jgi:hypothetical protein
MGVIKIKYKNFTFNDIKNKELILQMLKFEDELYLSDKGQEIMIDHGNNITNNLGSKAIQRLTLNNFGYLSDDENLSIYRKIFSYYYNSPKEYDEDILKSVYYMRENRILYYKEKSITIKSKIPNINIYKSDGKTLTDIYTNLNSKFSLIAAFSMS